MNFRDVVQGVQGSQVWGRSFEVAQEGSGFHHEGVGRGLGTLRLWGSPAGQPCTMAWLATFSEPPFTTWKCHTPLSDSFEPRHPIHPLSRPKP